MGACLGCQRQSDQEKEGQQVVSKKGDLEHAARTEADQLRSEQGSGDWKGVDTVAKGTANADIHDEELSTEAEVKEGLEVAAGDSGQKLASSDFGARQGASDVHRKVFQEPVVAEDDDKLVVAIRDAALPKELAVQQVAGRNSGVPTPLSQAPPGILATNAEIHYAPPYIPPPNVPPPEQADLEMTARWQPTHARALLIGCNYMRHPDIMLRGCVNDINCIKYMLTSRFGYNLDSIMMLQDQQPYPEYLPTKENILAGLQWLLGSVKESSGPLSLFFVFSGHGLRQPSADAAGEGQGPNQAAKAGAGYGEWEETILPSDYDSAGPITATELYQALIAPLTTNMRLHCCMDACHSGFSLDLPYHAYIRADGWAAWEKGKPRAPAQGRGDLGINRQPRRHGSVFCGTAGGEAILFGTSPDDDSDASLSQTDASNAKLHASTGAMVFALIQAVEQGQAATYSEVLRAMRYAGKNGPTHLNKLPEMSSSHIFNLNRPFVL